jgi:hypothetical protein
MHIHSFICLAVRLHSGNTILHSHHCIGKLSQTGTSTCKMTYTMNAKSLAKSSTFLWTLSIPRYYLGPFQRCWPVRLSKHEKTGPSSVDSQIFVAFRLETSARACLNMLTALVDTNPSLLASQPTLIHRLISRLLPNPMLRNSSLFISSI